jgi:hypothetical protein
MTHFVHSNFDVHGITTCEEWRSVLHIASEWGFASIRRLAIRELVPLTSPIDKIAIGLRYDIYDWLLDAYVAVCTRTNSLTEDEGEKLGVKDVIHISSIRDALSRGVAPSYIRKTVWRACCPFLADPSIEDKTTAEYATGSNPTQAAKLETEKKQAVVFRLREILAQADAELSTARAEEAQLVEEEERRAQNEAEEREAARIKEEDERVMEAAKRAGDAVQIARLELEKAEKAAAEARHADEEWKAQRMPVILEADAPLPPRAKESPNPSVLVKPMEGWFSSAPVSVTGKKPSSRVVRK